MKKFALFLGILIFLKIAYLAYSNIGQTLTFAYKPFFDSYSINTAVAIIFLAISSALGTYLIAYYKIASLNQRLKKQTRNIEKASVETEESADKIKALEAKIQTLEKALQDALKK